MSAVIAPLEADPLDLDPAEDSAPISVLSILRRGWRASPELRDGVGLTILLAMIGAAGRVVVPVLVQQVIDNGFDEGGIDVAQVVGLSAVGAVVVVVTTVATLLAARRLAGRASTHSSGFAPERSVISIGCRSRTTPRSAEAPSSAG